MPFYLINECWFIDSASNITVKMVVYLFSHHTHYDTFRPVIPTIIVKSYNYIQGNN